MIITLNGKAGTGKSSVAKELAQKIGYKFYSAGDVRRKYATDKGLTLAELNKQAETDSASDKLVDDYLKRIGGKEDNFVIDSRLGFFFIPKSIKIFLAAELRVRAQRTFDKARPGEKPKNLSEAMKWLEARDESDVKRYKKLYNVDPFALSHYDLFIDTSNNTVEQTLNMILDFLRKKKKMKI
ncbi:cytidylate kinase family protein [Candidatus Woesearchaeota archaeon]|nr:cytidylate kinase family protein [Candidatus Woesearchaeota archaeon]